MARFFVALISQAAGLRGTPSVGHCASAATSASCASSSAKPTSRTMRATLAISLADSIFQTAWIARSVSVGVEVVTPATTACCTLSASAELPRLFGRYFRGVEDLQHLGLAVASDRHEAL